MSSRQGYHGALEVWKRLLEAGLADDGQPWDWTTRGLGARATRPTRAKVVAKADGIWAGAECAAALESFGLRARSVAQDGAALRRGHSVVTLSGPAEAVLALERPFLNLVSYASGIATATHELVRLVRGACPKRTPRVTATRKTLPGYRDVAIAGLVAGGGFPHRVSLSGGVLIKENHVATAGGIRRAVEGARKAAPHGLKIELEVRDARELGEALATGVDVVLLDNFSPAQVKSALKSIDRAARRPTVEVSGGIDERTIASYAIPGVDVISCGSLTHSVRAVDFSLLVEGT
jgi:nicotinate-nucleotide pyrophosphorylase (carboxylating)